MIHMLRSNRNYLLLIICFIFIAFVLVNLMDQATVESQMKYNNAQLMRVLNEREAKQTGLAIVQAELGELDLDNPDNAITIELMRADIEERIAYINELHLIERALTSMQSQLTSNHEFTPRYIRSLNNYALSIINLQSNFENSATLLHRLQIENIEEMAVITEYSINHNKTHDEFLSLSLNQLFVNLLTSLIILIPIIISGLDIQLLLNRKSITFKFIPAKYWSHIVSYFGPKLISLWIFLISFRVFFHVFSYLFFDQVTILGQTPLNYQGDIIILSTDIVVAAYFVFLTLMSMVFYLVKDIVGFYIDDATISNLLSIIGTGGLLMFLIPAIGDLFNFPLWQHTISMEGLGILVGLPTSVEIFILYSVLVIIILIFLGFLHRRLWNKALKVYG